MSILQRILLPVVLTAALTALGAGCGDDSVISEPEADAYSDAYAIGDLGALDVAKTDGLSGDAADTAKGDAPDTADSGPTDAGALEVDAAPTDSDTAEVAPVNQAPTLSFVSPAEDATLQAGQAVTLELQAQDDGGADQLLVTAHYAQASAALWSGSPAADGKISFTLPSLAPGDLTAGPDRVGRAGGQGERGGQRSGPQA
jgi:hypothetical protein